LLCVSRNASTALLCVSRDAVALCPVEKIVRAILAGHNRLGPGIFTGP